MAGVNKVILLGNLGSDPEVRHLEGGSVVARFNIATSEAYTSRTGERVEQTEWHRIELWDNLAKIAEQYLRKGNQVYIEGKIKSESWKDKDGVEKTGIRIRATSMTLVGGRPNAGDGSDNTYDSPAAQAPQQAQPAAAPRPQAAPASQPAPRQQTARREPDPVFEPSGSDDDLPF